MGRQAEQVGRRATALDPHGRNGALKQKGAVGNLVVNVSKTGSGPALGQDNGLGAP